MGCCFSQIEGTGPVEEPPQPQPKREAPTKNYSKPKWKHEQGPLTAARLQAMRDEYWDTQPAYGGDKGAPDAVSCKGPEGPHCSEDSLSASEQRLGSPAGVSHGVSSAGA